MSNHEIVDLAPAFLATAKEVYETATPEHAADALRRWLEALRAVAETVLDLPDETPQELRRMLTADVTESLHHVRSDAGLPEPLLEYLRDFIRSTTGSPFLVGESLVGEGNELAHIDLIIGSKQGHAGAAFSQALSRNTKGFTTLLALVTPNLPAKPDTVLTNKVTIKVGAQAVRMFGPAQAAVARAVVDSVSSGVIPYDFVDDYCILVSVFIHWLAQDDKKIYDFNYRATKEAIERALRGQPKLDAVISGAKTATHPFAGGADRS